MKTPSATATAIVAVILLCALSTGGQQAARPDFIPDKQPNRIHVLRQGRIMPDGRVVGFPPSTSQEEIDALARRIAAGDVELLPGARVIGWQPVEGANSLLLGYEQRVATIPTVKCKLDALANAAGILQAQIDHMNADVKYAHARIAIEEKSSDHLAKIIDENTGALANDVSRLTMKTNGLDDLRRELDDFKAAACPVLRRAARGPGRSWDDVAGTMRAQDVQMKLDSACGRK